jgi:hypothetical protein
MTGGEAKLCGVRICEDGSGDVLQHAAVEEDGEGRVEEDGEGRGGLFEQKAVGQAFGSSAAEGEHGIGVTEGGGEGGGFEAAKAGLAVALEELGNGRSGTLLKVSVEIEKGPSEARGEEAADGGFACTHESGEDETAKVRRDHGFGG